MKPKTKNQKKIKSMEEVILDFQRKNIESISFKPESRTPLRFPLAEDLKKAGYIHKSELSKYLDIQEEEFNKRMNKLYKE